MDDQALRMHDLNSEQLQAVTHASGSLLVLAGAGSGKTKVLTTRLAWLIKKDFLGLSEVLAVTFTNKAAREMLQRVAALLQVETKAMWVGTFHSLALRLLRFHAEAAGLAASFQIIDASEQQSLIKRLIKQQGLAEERYPAKELQAYINYQKEQGLRASELTAEGLRSQQWIDIYQLYEKTCNRDSLVDFTELLLRSYELLLLNSALLKRYQCQFKHILVDEFQDTNQLQYKWLQLLVGVDSSIFAVGDDDQSIYAFRGAKVSNMRAFLRDFRAPEPIRLEQNYRSSPIILAAANALISHNSQRIGKNLWTQKPESEKIRLYEGYTEEDEAFFVVDEIKSLANSGIELAEMAILYRSNAQSRVFEQQLYNRGVAYRVYGGLRFFDRQEIKRVLAYLRLIVNPDDNEAFLRVVNFPARGIGPKALEVLQAVAQPQQLGLFAAVDLLPLKAKLTLTKFSGLIRMMQQETQVLSLAETISYIIETSGMREYYQNDNKGGAERVDNLNELVTAVSGFVAEDNSNPVVEFLAHSVLESLDAQAQNYESAVQLMTVHAAKGLEFKVVFVVGLEDGLFPYDNSLQHNPQAIEEERRLMYVAITRAKDQLYLLRACSRLLWGKRLTAPLSRFVNEIPEELILNLSGVSKIGYSQAAPQVAKTSFNSLRSVARTNPEPKTSGVVLKDREIMLQIGDMIRHAKFGNGKILRLNSEGSKMTAEIFFIGLGKKTLDLNIATIDKI